MSQADFFDNIAPKWDSIIEVNEQKINLLLSKINIPANAEILDIGTGTGVLVPFLKKIAPQCKILGVDISEKMLEVGRQKWTTVADVQFLKTDVETDKTPGMYDAIVLYSVFPHFQNRTETIARLINNNLKPSGQLIIAHSNSRQYLNNLHRKAGETVKEDRLIAIEAQRHLFEQAGLCVTDAFENDEIYFIVLTHPNKSA